MNNIWTPSLITLTHPSLFTSFDLERFEKEILTNPQATEREASLFFSEFPKFLYLGHGAEIRREVVLFSSRDLPIHRVDFFRRPYGKQFWDIIELKDPNKPFIVGQQSQHPHLSAEVEKAISQALDYRDFINQDTTLRGTLLKKGVMVCRPQIVVIVGKYDDRLPQEEIQLLYDRVRQRGGIEALSYNDLYKFAQDHYTSGRVFIIPAYFDPHPAMELKEQSLSLLRELLIDEYLQHGQFKTKFPANHPRESDRQLSEELYKLRSAELIISSYITDWTSAYTLTELGRRIALGIESTRF